MAKISKNKSKSSQTWLKEHRDDIYVRQSKVDGYRSRAAYKLLELNKKDKLLKRGMTVVDLGAAPGGWSQVAVKLVMPGGMILATDILEMEAIPGVDFIQGDFTESSCLDELLKRLGERHVDLVISDMAPNISGMSAIDQPRAMHLVDLAVDFAENKLHKDGSLLMKVFQGEGFESVLKQLRADYQSVVSRKPDASRARSKEIYLLAKGKRR
ncbi:MAG: 23S rRNA (uridine(2552)-2'-O)-methyltransferase RlmE [SAR86 cluster bacterium]|uniref:Ribosomal RNA large subunit methyltransferase E n=1 Tax=SAR86 cluster bacterium TaxID=2030880 RepID=A0A2A5CGD6_9GAMM|nr:MAG: 23S rRNA (uridine(2552)-2'-O)-methyltransferase RlmE [SAR86 cluster bacterium]